MTNRLFYKKRANAWEEALPVGNGRVGAMVFGNLKTERIALNEDTLWSGYPKDKNKKDAHQYLPAIREAIFAGNRKEAARLANVDMRGHWSEAYLPFGDIGIHYQHTRGGHYRRTLDLTTGIAEAQNSAVCETVFVSHPAQLLVVHIQSDSGVSFRVELSSKLRHRTYTEQNTLFMEGEAPEICMPPYYHTGTTFAYGEGAMRFCGAVKVLGAATFGEDFIAVEQQKDVTLLISLATGFVDFRSMPTADAKARALAYFEKAAASNEAITYEALLAAHQKDVAALMNRVEVDFGTERADLPTDKRLKRYQKHSAEDANLAALLFQYGRYLTVAASRPDSQAMNLQGIFNEHLRAPWSSNYTTNINTEMNYWACDIANLSECFAPFFALVKNMVENGRTTAADYYACGGSCAHHNVDIWGSTYPAGDPAGKSDCESYACWQSTLPWMLNQVYEHYRYTQEPALFEEMKPYFREVLHFYQDFLIEKDGVMVTCPTISPENIYIDNGKRASLTYLPTMDIGILEEFFENCRTFGFETPALPPIPVGQDGRIMEWQQPYEEAEPHHRHVSHLYCIYPSAMPQSEAVEQAAAQSLLTRGFDGTGWSLGWKVCLWARLRHPENAMRLIKKQLRPIMPLKRLPAFHGGSYPNLLDAHPPFQIDGNFGVTAGIAELLKNKTVPAEWNGYAKGIQLHGGKRLNIRFQNGIAEETEE